MDRHTVDAEIGRLLLMLEDGDSDDELSEQAIDIQVWIDGELERLRWQISFADMDELRRICREFKNALDEIRRRRHSAVLKTYDEYCLAQARLLISD